MVGGGRPAPAAPHLVAPVNTRQHLIWLLAIFNLPVAMPVPTGYSIHYALQVRSTRQPCGSSVKGGTVLIFVDSILHSDAIGISRYC
jgi:hypothetical protein